MQLTITVDMSQRSMEHRVAAVQKMMDENTACSSAGASILRVESLEHMSEIESMNLP